MGIKGKNIKKIVFERDNGLCQRCGIGVYLNREDKEPGKLKAHIHHKQHKIDGGLNTEDNLQLTCWPCERKYHAKQYTYEDKSPVNVKGDSIKGVAGAVILYQEEQPTQTRQLQS